MPRPSTGNNSSPTRRALSWAHGVVTVESLGGMLGPTLFVLPDGRQVAPLQIAPWAGEPGGKALPGILRRLRGEWPCVPFGNDGDRIAADGWPASRATPTVDADAHGFGSNHDWTIAADDPSRLELAIDYPQSHPIARLERRITPDPAAAAIDLELTVIPRRDCDLPIGLHPVLRLPETPGAMHIELPESISAMTFPGDPDATSIFARGRFVENWRQVPGRDGRVIDPSRVPLPQPTEDLLQLLQVPGEVSLWNTAEGYRVRLSWNAEHFPTLLFWFSNRGRQFAPWSGRHLALGVEPVCGAFDLGPQVSGQPNPVSAHGVPTTHRFVAGEPFLTRYRIAIETAPLG